MESLSKENRNCADCDDSQVEDANMDIGITLCPACANTHQKVLKTPTRKLTDLNEEEINYINKRGNVKSNEDLLKNAMQWTISLKTYNFQLVREWFIEAKYSKQAFNREKAKRKVKHDFTNMWFFLDEVSREVSWVKGPYRRQAIKKMLDDNTHIFRDSYVWHPVLGNKWMLVEKVYDIISPPSSLSDSALQEACLKKLHLQSLPHPHLRGNLEVFSKNINGKKWLVIIEKYIVIFTNSLNLAIEKKIGIDDINDISLEEKSNKLYIQIEDTEGLWCLTSLKTDEVIEWFHAISCCRYLYLALGLTDYPSLNIDNSEIAVCNVKSSPEYLGEKLHEGSLKKQGQNWRNTRVRWFVLRSLALYYYLNKTDKAPKNSFKLSGKTEVDWKTEYKQPFHFSLSSADKVLHFWADSQNEKEIWVGKLLSTIEQLKWEEENQINSPY